MSTQLQFHKYRQRELEQTAHRERLARQLRAPRRRDSQRRLRWLGRLAALFA